MVNVAHHRTGELNDAELGMANLEKTLQDPALLSDVVEMLREPNNLRQFAETLANPKFQEEAKHVASKMKASGDLAGAFESYAKVQKPWKLSPKLFQALNPAVAFTPVGTPARQHSSVTRSAEARMETMEDLKSTAGKLNPVVGFWDPLNLAAGEFWGDSNEATIGFLREAEIKHGRIAMAGFVGYIVHANDIRFPWKPFNEAPSGVAPQALWDSIPEIAKWQIILTIGFFEYWRENAYVLEQEGQKHYMRAGKPGYFPTFAQLPHPVPLNLYDPLGFAKNDSPEKKARQLLVEINNGRLAMIGLMGFLAESQTPGSVPALKSLGIRPYDGNIMAPFDANFHIFQ